MDITMTDFEELPMYKIYYWVDGERKTVYEDRRMDVDELLDYLEVGTRYEVWKKGDGAYEFIYGGATA